ncbi:KGK domain-containing protein [Microcoleus sp. w1-18aA5]|uniref:KGK domain-containing protein n=1 Tax=Microcoleus sp. w1-18aA5 TaxID=2818982 RepID=UPI002FD7277B
MAFFLLITSLFLTSVTKSVAELPSFIKITTINMDESPIFPREDDVVSAPTSALMYQCTFKVSEFMAIMQAKLVDEKLFSDGLDCEFLSAGKDWTKGKLRMRLEFIPLEAEIKEQKALPAAAERSDTVQNYAVASSNQTNIDEPLNQCDSTEISNHFPISRYPDRDPQNIGMWS